MYSFWLLFVLGVICFAKSASAAPSKDMPMPGAPVQQDSNDEEIQKVAQHAVDEYNKQHPSDTPYFLKKVKKATTQVVAGINYDLELELVQSATCKKGEVCASANGPTKTINSKIWVKPWVNEKPVQSVEVKEI